MRLVGTLVLLGVISAQARILERLHPREQYESAFFDWAREHNIQLPHGKEFVQRLENFIENSDWIERHNGGNHSYTLGHNRFSHMSYDEFKMQYLGWQRPLRMEMPEESSVLRVLHVEAEELPDTVDWVAKGAVTSVKDQGQCGSCYTFSATGAIEGAYAIKYGHLMDLSMQQIVDCDDLDGGCQGGEMQQAFAWVKENGGLCSLNDYPYQSGDTETAGQCKKCKVVSGTAPASWTTVRRNSAKSLASALTQQPVSVAVGASKDWMFYKEGIFTGKCEEELNHGILAVGYSSNDQGTYWVVKNSWGTNWGVNGYIYLSRDEESQSCGILQDASYPALDGVQDGLLRRGKGTGSAKDCGGGTVVFDELVVEPTDVQKNQLVTLKASGILNKPTTSGTYQLTVTLSGAEVYSHSGSVCGTEAVTLPLNVGTINLYGFDCPANPGPVTYGLDVKLPSIAPSGDYKISLTAVDQDAVNLMCIETDLSL